MENYPYLTDGWRAQAVNVVDGDTVDLFVDTGFFGYKLLRFRFLDIDTPEMNDRDPELRFKARTAKSAVATWLNCFERQGMVSLTDWPLRIETEKKPDSFGRWLVRIFYKEEGDEKSLNAMLLESNLAVPYEK